MIFQDMVYGLPIVGHTTHSATVLTINKFTGTDPNSQRIGTSIIWDLFMPFMRFFIRFLPRRLNYNLLFVAHFPRVILFHHARVAHFISMIIYPQQFIRI